MAEIFWDVLGIKPTVDSKKIRKAYSDLVKLHNPEDDEETFRKINQAYRAAMNFARQFSAMNVKDEDIVITDVRQDGSFGIKIVDETGKNKPLIPPVPAPEPAPVETSEVQQEEAKTSDSKFDFGSIDSSKVKGLTYQEIDEMTGYLSLAPGFPVPDSDKARKIKKFIDDNDLVKTMSERVAPENIKKGIETSINTATLILNEDSLRGERIMWNFYFNSPMVISLHTSYEFYGKLQKTTDEAKVTIKDAMAISDVCPLRPRVYATNRKENPVSKIDFLSKVPFRYKEGKYPAFDELMKNEDPEEVKALIDFLEHSRINLYAMLMPVIYPIKSNALPDAISSFHFILKSPDCEKMRDKPILWKLYFRGVLLKTLISNHDLHVGLTKIMLDMNLSNDLVKTIKKQIG